VYDVQAVLKRDHSSALDKYKMKASGTTRWKVAVGVSALLPVALLPRRRLW
jgi:hypothetical protein